MPGPASKQLLLPRLPAAALWLPSLTTRTPPAHVPRKDSDIGPPLLTMVLQAEEVHMLSVTPKRAKPDPGCLPGQTLGPEHTWVTMVTFKAAVQVPVYVWFPKPCSTLQRSRPLMVKVALFSPGERGWGRVGFKMIKSDMRCFLCLTVLRLYPQLLACLLPLSPPSSWKMWVQPSWVPPG